MSKIIETDSNDHLVLNILLDLLSMGTLDGDETMVISDKTRYQTTFWKEFIKYFSKFGSEAHKLEMCKKFEGIFVRLID